MTRKPSKYRNVKVEHEGEKFDSKAELRRYLELRILERAGKIFLLQRQPSFDLAPKTKINGKTVRALRYIADFGYLNESGCPVIEDVKGVLTAAYKIKRHLMKTINSIDILETK